MRQRGVQLLVDGRLDREANMLVDQLTAALRTGYNLKASLSGVGHPCAASTE